MTVRTILPALMLGLFASTASAALTVTIEDSPGYLPGTTMAGVGVFVSSTGGDNFAEFEINIDILPAGAGNFPAGITIWNPGNQANGIGVSNKNPIWTSLGANIVNTGAFVIFSNRGVDFVTPSTPTRLFDITFDIAPGTTLAAYEVRFQGSGMGGSGAGFESTFRTSGGFFLSGITYNSGALNVVPEPSTFSLAGLGLLAFSGLRRRRAVG